MMYMKSYSSMCPILLVWLVALVYSFQSLAIAIQARMMVPVD